MKAAEGRPAAAAAADTVPKMFWHGVTARRDEVILRQKQFGLWHSITWGEFGAIAREIGMGLVALGFEPGECASVLSNTNREWLYADFGILGASIAGTVWNDDNGNGIFASGEPFLEGITVTLYTGSAVSWR